MICARCGKNFNKSNASSNLILCCNGGKKLSYGSEGCHIGYTMYPLPASQAFSSASMEPIYVPYNLCPDCQKALEEWFTKKGSDP